MLMIVDTQSLFLEMRECLLFFLVCYVFLLCGCSNSVQQKLSTSFLFTVLDSKAPKSEDIDEEDDDVPGRHINLHVYLMYEYSIHALEYLALDVIILLIC